MTQLVSHPPHRDVLGWHWQLACQCSVHLGHRRFQPIAPPPHTSVAALLFFAAALPLLAGCDSQCEPPITDAPVPLAQADLSSFWSDPAHTRITIVRTDQPYRLSDFALTVLLDALADPIGLEATVIEDVHTALPAAGTVPADEVIAAGRALAPATADPVLVIIEVSQTDAAEATYGFLSYQNSPTPIAVMAVHRDAALAHAVGPVTAETIEALTALHELGHWFEVPARPDHISSVDHQHCTNAQCVMFKGSRIGSCAILANVLTGPPLHFGPDCAAELTEMKRRRSSPLSAP